MFIDSHAHLHHLDLTPYKGSLDSALKEAKIQGVSHILCVCIHLNELPTLLSIAHSYPDISISVGLHPNEVIEQEPSEAELIQLASDEKVIALGETGLDYYRTAAGASWQKERFRRHISAAQKINKPLIIHTRNAQADTLQILKEENKGNLRGVFHCFTETWEVAAKALDLGFYISFSGIITFKNSVELQEVVKKTPLDRILIETDCPYLAPVPYRGKSNEPAYIRFVAEKVANLKQLTVQKVAFQSSKNFKELFNL